MSRVFSGIQPTGGGHPHLGNYLGALRGYVSLQHGNEALFCVADQHATTVPHDPAGLGRACLVTAAALLASGVDASTAAVFRQSAVRAHSVLSQLLGHVATLGPLERMTQFKEKGRVTEGPDRDSIGLGLLTYPVLMAADILVHRTELVPVGQDQHQHLQLAASLAKRFNHRFSTDLFPVPRRIVQEGAGRVMSLRDPTRKMSKSDPLGCVFLTDDADTAAAKFRRAVAETEPLPSEPGGLAGRPAAASLVGLLSAMLRVDTADVLAVHGGRGFSSLKSALADAHAELIVPVGRRMAGILDDEAALRGILADGAARASAGADATVDEAYRLVGF